MTTKNTSRKNFHSVYTLNEIRKKLLSSRESEENFEFYHRYYLQGMFFLQGGFLGDTDSDLELEDVEGLEFDELSKKIQIVVCKCIQKKMKHV